MLHIQNDIPVISEARTTGKRHRIWLEVLKFLAVSSVVNLLVVIASDSIMKIFFESNLSDGNASMLKYLYGNILGILIIIIYCYYIEKRTLTDIGFTKSEICKQYAKGVCIGFLLFSSIVFIGNMLNVFTFGGKNENVNLKIVLLFLGGFMIQGMFEETVFRGYFMLSLARKNSIFTAIIINSIIFGLMHGFNNGFQIIAFINLTLLGLFESIYMLKTGNIWAISAIHSIWNFAQGLIYGFNISGISQTQSIFKFNSMGLEAFSGGNFGPEGSLLTTIVLMSVTMIVIFQKKRNLICKCFKT